MTVLFGCCIGALFAAFLFRLLAVCNRTAAIKTPAVLSGIVFVHLFATSPCIWAFIVAFRDDDVTREALRVVMIRLSTIFV